MSEPDKKAVSGELSKIVSSAANLLTAPKQHMCLEEQYCCAEVTRDKMEALLKDITRHTSLTEGNAFMGPNKDRQTAEDKVIRRFDGDDTFITDVVRGKIVIDDAQQLAEIQEILASCGSDLMREHDIEVAHINDNFATPKQYTWYRGLGYKLSVPTDNGQAQIIELQVVSSAMESIYDVTHLHKRAAEDIYNKAAKEGRELTEEELEHASQHYAVCQWYNSKVAHDEGFDHFLKDKEKYGFTDEREKKLMNMMKHVNLDLG